jgi:serine/threonine protein kinase/TolB-like protein/Tfp pilus assembly protein PilF
MTPERLQQIEELFHSALALEPSERAELLAQACDGDEALRTEVESLLRSHNLSESFIEQPAADVAAELLAGGQARLEAGQTINHYRVIASLGAGGMGEVYLAKDQKLDRQVAIKILNEKFSRDESNLKRFVREAKAASALNHPNILVIHEIGESEGAHYIVSEFVEGQTLREVLTQSQMSLEEVLDVSIQIAGALSAAHGAHLVHRDIKPENVMVRPDGYVKVLDFGLAKLVEQENTFGLGDGISRNQTAKGMILGTVNYMSPEQAKGEEVDEQTDIFSLGVVMYEMIGGETPFAGNSMAETFANLINAEPRPLSPLDSDVPDELKRIVAKTLHKNKDERYQTMKDLLADLKVVRETATYEGKLEKAQANGTTYAFLQTLRRHKVPAAVALAALLMSAIGLGYYFVYSPQRAPNVGGKKSIAILPLKPIDAANRDEIYEIGIADSLIHRLSSMKGFIVRPLSATRKYADIDQDPLAAGQDERVDYVLASNYQLAGGKIRITAQLFNVTNGQIEETYKSERDAANVFAMQDAIAVEVGNMLTARFGSTLSSQAARRGTTNEDAYRLYLQGMYILDKRNLADAQKAAEIFERAVRIDPNYAMAWAGKAHAHRSVANFGRSVNIHDEYQKSMEAISKALALDENLADAHSALCENKMLYEWDFGGAERECKRAIELDSNSSLAHQIYSRYLMGRGRFDEAIAEIKIAIDLEPASLYSQRLYGNNLYNARRYEEAVLQYKRVIAMDPNFGTTYPWLVFALEMQGNHAEAFDWWMKFLALQKADEMRVRTFKAAYQTSGWEGVLREQTKMFDKGNEAYFYGASYHAQLGNKEQAFEFLERSYERRELWMHVLNVEPRLDPLRGDQRFDELVKRVGLN